MPQLSRRVEERAGDIARSLISEGYLFRSSYTYGTRDQIVLFMRHHRNGNVMRAEVGPNEVKLWKNQKLVKAEPLAARAV